MKTAFFASDPNLGRILAAVGYAGIEDLDQTRIELHLDEVHVATRGGRNPAYREEDGQREETNQRIDPSRDPWQRFDRGHHPALPASALPVQTPSDGRARSVKTV